MTGNHSLLESTKGMVEKRLDFPANEPFLALDQHRGVYLVP